MTPDNEPQKTEPKSREFEQLIARIHRALEDSGSLVQWNERVTDPIDEGGTRQIDVTIRRDGWVTFVECRIHKRPQDVGWIEQLHGRKESLGANSIIAVSSSGFTEKAQKYAAYFGILLRDLNELSEAEVKAWGTSSARSIVSFRYKPLTIHIPGPIIRNDGDPSFTDVEGEPISWRHMLREISQKADKESVGRKVDFNGIIGPFILNGVRVDKARVVGQVQKQVEMRRVSQISIYSDPQDGVQHSSVERFGSERTELIRSTGKCSLVFDVGSIQLPENSVFGSMMIDAGEQLKLAGYSVVGNLVGISRKFLVDFSFLPRDQLGL